MEKIPGRLMIIKKACHGGPFVDPKGMAFGLGELFKLTEFELIELAVDCGVENAENIKKEVDIVREKFEDAHVNLFAIYGEYMDGDYSSPNQEFTKIIHNLQEDCTLPELADLVIEYLDKKYLNYVDKEAVEVLEIIQSIIDEIKEEHEKAIAEEVFEQNMKDREEDNSKEKGLQEEISLKSLDEIIEWAKVDG